MPQSIKAGRAEQAAGYFFFSPFPPIPFPPSPLHLVFDAHGVCSDPLQLAYCYISLYGRGFVVFFVFFFNIFLSQDPSHLNLNLIDLTILAAC